MEGGGGGKEKGETRVHGTCRVEGSSMDGLVFKACTVLNE